LKKLEICVATRTEQLDLKNHLVEALILITFMILFVIFRFYSSFVYNFELFFLYHLWFIVYLKFYKSWTDFIIIILEE
jgi:ABC-type multidrug transport system permease subunit